MSESKTRASRSTGSAGTVADAKVRDVASGQAAGPIAANPSGVEAQIQKAQREGQFDELPGKGKPLRNLDDAYDPLWWGKSLLEREQLSVLPPALEVRRDVERALLRLPSLRSERQVRQLFTVLDQKIAALNRAATSGPPTRQSRLDVEAIVERWRKG